MFLFFLTKSGYFLRSSDIILAWSMSGGDLPEAEVMFSFVSLFSFSMTLKRTRLLDEVLDVGEALSSLRFEDTESIDI